MPTAQWLVGHRGIARAGGGARDADETNLLAGPFLGFHTKTPAGLGGGQATPVILSLVEMLRTGGYDRPFTISTGLRCINGLAVALQNASKAVHFTIAPVSRWISGATRARGQRKGHTRHWSRPAIWSGGSRRWRPRSDRAACTTLDSPGTAGARKRGAIWIVVEPGETQGQARCPYVAQGEEVDQHAAVVFVRTGVPRGTEVELSN